MKFSPYKTCSQQPNYGQRNWLKSHQKVRRRVFNSTLWLNEPSMSFSSNQHQFENPTQKTKLRTSNWPHSEIGTQYRPKDIGENISWDLSENGSPCYESVYRWYSELFYYDPANLVGRRGSEPIGHLTQMLWASSTAIGCARTQKLIKQPPNYVPRYQRSGYTVCHYAPQGNIVGLQHDNWNDLDSKYCSTYDNYTGESECATGGTCQGKLIFFLE